MTIRERLTATSIDRRDATILFAHLLRKDRSWIGAHDDTLLTAAQLKAFRRLEQRRLAHTPIAYLIGEKEFYGRPFRVNASVLIPRPETELFLEMVQQAIQQDADMKNKKVVAWDVGTGSGALAITIAKEFPRMPILATDISLRALTVATHNAKRLRASRVTLLQANLLDQKVNDWLIAQAPSHLIIVANLPYLPTSDKKYLAPDVVHHEPHLALFAGKDGRRLMNTFLKQISQHQLPRPSRRSIFLEFDPPQVDALTQYAHQLFPQAAITIHCDLAEKARILEIQEHQE